MCAARAVGGPRKSRTRNSAIALIVSALLAAPANAVPGKANPAALEPQQAVSATSPVLDEAARVALSNEEWEEKGASVFFDGQSRAPELQRANSRLERYLQDHPNDVRALLLKARISRGLIVVTPVGIQTDEKGTRLISGDTSKIRADALAAIDRALALEPANAEAFYWRARILSLYAPSVEELQSGKQRFDPAPIIDAAKNAVRLAPSNAVYVEYLALALIANDQRTDAVQELRKLPGKHPLLQLIEDVDLVPVPPGAKVDEQGWSELWTEGFKGHMDVYKYPGLRAFIYTVALPLKDVEAFYASTWPGIHFKTERSADIEAAMAALEWRGTQLDPIADPAIFAVDLDKQLPPSGVTIMLSSAGPKQPQSTLIVVINLRRF